jgi:hypothetical protein
MYSISCYIVDYHGRNSRDEDNALVFNINRLLDYVMQEIKTREEIASITKPTFEDDSISFICFMLILRTKN